MKAEHLILLRCSKKNFAIKADFVVEVIKIDFLQKVPGSHDNIAGVSVHRGILLPLYFIDQEHAGSDKLFYAIILYKFTSRIQEEICSLAIFILILP